MNRAHLRALQLVFLCSLVFSSLAPAAAGSGQAMADHGGAPIYEFRAVGTVPVTQAMASVTRAVAPATEAMAPATQAIAPAVRAMTPAAGDSAAIHAQSRAFSRAYERGDVDAMMAIYAEDAVIFPGNLEAIKGRDALRAYWALGPVQRVTHHEATPAVIRIEGDMASDYGVYEVAGIRGGEAWGPFRGKYLIVWRKEADGQWRMELDMWNARSREVQPAIDCAETASEGKIHASCVTEVDLSEHFEKQEGAFILYDMREGTARVHNRPRARERFVPASTFKIPNSIIALESGTVSGPDFALAWDSVTTPPQSWWPATWKRDQTLQSAFRNSVVWYYQELARRMGEESIQRWLDRFDYGNRDIRGSVDGFWLRGPLTISPFEQVAFLDRLSKSQLGVSDRTTQIVKEMLVLEEGDGYVLSGKTGTLEVTATRELGWLVGYVQADAGEYAFALNIEGERVWEDWPPQKRSELVKVLLGDLGVIPEVD